MRHVLQALAVVVHAAFAAPAPALASSTADWDGTGCTLRSIEGQAHVAQLDCENRLTGGQPITRAELTADGLTVGLTVFHGPGDIPDRFIVVVPDGFFAVPSEVDIPENAGDTVLIYEWTGM